MLLGYLIKQCKRFIGYLQHMRDQVVGPDLLELFDNECALCETKISKSTCYYVDSDIDYEGVFIPTCKHCHSLNNSGFNWMNILKNNYKNKTRRYTTKYLRVFAFIRDSD